ncbi:alpha/beta fold hydrolase [Candidatus Woesearchaeota archaeon]|nr:alpha/beta fold hydrolase [Candidatus Woesearchaeota archaeon]
MRIKKKHLIGIAVAAAIIIAAFFYFKPFQKPEPKPEEKDDIIWLVDSQGYLVYPPDRGEIKFARENYGETENLTISRIIYPSRNGNVYGLLVLPKSASDLMPGIVLLPGAGVSKESELELAKKISSLGAAVLTIDQRGTGETTGRVNTIEQDYADFINAREPSQHLMVYDALRAYDLLYSAPFVDPGRIIIAGESLGGRIAVIAAAIDRNIEGVLAISSAGFGFEMTNDTRVNAFLNSIDSDHYIDQISPRKLVMMHNAYDTKIPLSSAAKSYSKALEPKQFILVNDTGCDHGYCDSMHEGLVAALDYLVDIRSRTLVSLPSG